ncbi:MAG: EamA family transporter [Mangrovibacterium sp.]
MWIIPALLSAVLLGLYQSFKKFAVNGNAVLPVLFGSIVCSTAVVVPLLAGSALSPGIMKSMQLYIPPLNLAEHGMILLKSLIVVTSWLFAFHAMKHLPLTIVTPIQATGPIWTLTGAILIFREQLNLQQWFGVIITLLFFYLLSTAGKREGINFRRNKWIMLAVAGVLLSATSGLYDKFIIRRIDRLAVQAWFTIYQLAIMLPVMALFRWSRPRKKRIRFSWRISIPAIGIFLLMSDFAYFYALSFPDSMISVISALRRGDAVVSFAIGALFFRELNLRAKGVYLTGILLGIVLLSLAS